MARAYLSIGSNLGDRIKNCELAVLRLGRVPGIVVLDVSSAFETEPVGKTDQPDFINRVVGVDVELDPHTLLVACKRIEDEMGREPGERWGPRVIDLDVLLFGDQVVEDDDLILPHPRMHERRFVLEPLVEIAPVVRHPLLEKTASELLGNLGTGGGRVHKANPLDREVSRS